MVQLTVISIDGYGPWTHTLGTDREHKLQMYQSMLYESLQNMFSVKGGLVFSNRFDEFFAITNGLSYSDHLEIKSKIEELFPFKITMSLATSEYPFMANRRAYLARASGFGKSVVADFKEEKEDDMVNLIHLDIENITKTSDITTPFEVTMIVQATLQILNNYCYKNNLLSFFMGGDNFVIISDNYPKKHSKKMADEIFNKLGLLVNCGIGKEHSPRIAMALATKNLDTIRVLRERNEEFPRILDSNSIPYGIEDIHIQ